MKTAPYRDLDFKKPGKEFASNSETQTTLKAKVWIKETPETDSEINPSPWKSLETAEEAKIIGRKLSRQTPKEQYENICKEYSSLTDKMFAEGLSRKEELRQIYLKWAKNRIEDAYYGEPIDYLESLANIKESIAEDLGQFMKSMRK